MLGPPQLTQKMQKKLIDGVHTEVGSLSIDELATERDEIPKTGQAKPAKRVG